MEIREYMNALDITQERFKETVKTDDALNVCSLIKARQLYEEGKSDWRPNQKKIYESAALVADQILNNDENRLKETVSRIQDALSKLPKESVVADVGCGTGIFSCYLAMENPEIDFVGMDFSSNMIKMSLMKKSLFGLDNIEFYESDIRNIASKEDTFDVVYHVNEDWETPVGKYIEGFSRILKNEGEVFGMKYVSDKYKPRQKDFKEKSYTYKFDDYDLELKEKVEVFGKTYLVIQKGRKISRLRSGSSDILA